MPFNMLLSASYVGNRANFLPSQLNPINQLSPQYLSLASISTRNNSVTGMAC